MEKHFKQLIIARRDLNMSPGKLAAQVSSAFLIEMIRDSWPEKVQDFYQVNYRLDKDIYDSWINDGVTKVVNKGKLEKAIEKAKELGMIEGVDYFPIVDACRTELIPESPQGTLTEGERKTLKIIKNNMTASLRLSELCHYAVAI
jgi:PTH2 family peptidyl-tRNA hydrolase